MGGDYIPRADGEYDRFFKNIYDYVIKMARDAPPQDAWKHIPDEDIDTIAEQYDIMWRKAYDAVLKPHTQPETKEKNRLRIVTERYLRTFVNRFLRHEPVSDFDRNEMGIPNPKGSRTPKPVPSTIPELEADSSVIRQITLHFRDKGASRRGKPENIHCIEIRWGVLDKAPDSPQALLHVEHDTASPHVLEFTECERGKRVYAIGRWRNSKEEAGPWGEFFNAVIP